MQIKIKKIWDVFSYIGFCFFNFFIVSAYIHYGYSTVINRGYEVSKFGLLLIMLFGLGWLSRMFKYDMEKETINNLRNKYITDLKTTQKS